MVYARRKLTLYEQAGFMALKRLRVPVRTDSRAPLNTENAVQSHRTLPYNWEVQKGQRVAVCGILLVQ